MISGAEQPDSGSVELGESVQIASVEQFRDSMDDKNTVWQEISGGQDIMRINNTEIPSRAYVGRFNFRGGDQQKSSAPFQVVSVTVCTLLSYCKLAVTYYFSMNQPMI